MTNNTISEELGVYAAIQDYSKDNIHYAMASILKAITKENIQTSYNKHEELIKARVQLVCRQPQKLEQSLYKGIKAENLVYVFKV